MVFQDEKGLNIVESAPFEKTIYIVNEIQKRVRMIFVPKDNRDLFFITMVIGIDIAYRITFVKNWHSYFKSKTEEINKTKKEDYTSTQLLHPPRKDSTRKSIKQKRA